MTKAELETKHLAELHALAAENGVERYRLLTRAELVERLAGGESGGETGSGRAAAATESRAERGSGSGEGSGERPRRRRRRSGGAAAEDSAADGDGGGRDEDAEPRSRGGRDRSERDRGRRDAEPEGAEEESSARPAPPADAAEPARPRRRRRRRFGRRGKQGVTLPGLLLPPEPGRQAVLSAESREACTALLRSVAAELATASKGPDPVALLIDPSPEELADWKRDAPQAEIVAAGQPRHADDALAQAAARAAGGEDVILLVDSLNRLGEAYGDPDAAKDFFDAGRSKAASSGSGTLTVVAALERTA